jgi:hypothetical protein
MSIIRGPENDAIPPKGLMDAIGALTEEGFKTGAIVDMGGLMSTATGARFRIRKGKVSVTDGPFTEAKEVIGGFCVLEVKSKEEAMEWTQRFMDLHTRHWPQWEGEAEIRQMYGPGEGPPTS